MCRACEPNWLLPNPPPMVSRPLNMHLQPLGVVCHLPVKPAAGALVAMLILPNALNALVRTPPTIGPAPRRAICTTPSPNRRLHAIYRASWLLRTHSARRRHRHAFPRMRFGPSLLNGTPPAPP